MADQESTITREELSRIIDERVLAKIPKAVPAPSHSFEDELRHHEEQGNNAHPVYSFMRSCPNCGKPNTEYRPSPYKCKNCHVPVNLESGNCWNCGHDEAEKAEEEE